MSFNVYGAAGVDTISPGKRYVRGVLPSGREGDWDVLEIDVEEGAVSTLDASAYEASWRADLPVVPLAQAIARSSGFELRRVQPEPDRAS